MVVELGPFEEPEDLQGIMGVLLHWAHLLRAREPPEVRGTTSCLKGVCLHVPSVRLLPGSTGPAET